MTVATPELAAALIAAQSEFDTVTKDAMNPHFGKTYATLKSAVDMASPILARNGLAVTQTFGIEEGGGDTLTTTLIHQSGQSISGTMRLLLDKPSSQGLGSASTYARRYGYMAILGLVADDDDGNEAERFAQAPRQQQGPAPQQQARSQPQVHPSQGGTASRVAAAAGRTQSAPAAPAPQQQRGPDSGEAINKGQSSNLYRLFKKAESDLGWDKDRYRQEVALFGDGVTDDRQLTKRQASDLISNMKQLLGEEDERAQAPQPQYQEPQQQYAYDDNEPF